jgi:hypothetical protein
MSRMVYLAIMFLFDMCKECGIAEIGLAAGALKVAGFDADAEVVVEGIVTALHATKSIDYTMGN